MIHLKRLAVLKRFDLVVFLCTSYLIRLTASSFSRESLNSSRHLIQIDSSILSKLDFRRWVFNVTRLLSRYSSKSLIACKKNPLVMRIYNGSRYLHVHIHSQLTLSFVLCNTIHIRNTS